MSDQPSAPHKRAEFANQVTTRWRSPTPWPGGPAGPPPSGARRRPPSASPTPPPAWATWSRSPPRPATPSTGNWSPDSRCTSPRPTAANSGQGTYNQPDKLARYLDPEHERALASLAKANAEYEARKQADRQRRLAVDCHNAYGPSAFRDHQACDCVYCRPDEHLPGRRNERQHPGDPFNELRCLCGQPVSATGERCPSHRKVALVELDGDGSALQLLADEPGYRPPETTDKPHPQRGEPGTGHGVEL